MSARKRAGQIALAVALFTLSVTPAIAAPRASTGVIALEVQGTDGLPVEGASVKVSELKGRQYKPVAEVLSNAEGEVELAVKAGSYELTIDAPDADTAVLYTQVQRQESTSLEVTLQSYGGVAGTLADAETGDPIVGAIAEFYLQDTDGSWSDTPTFTVTATDGTYSTGPIPAGSYRVRGTASGYAPRYFDGVGLGSPTVVVNRGDEITGVDISLTRLAESGRISGRVVSGASETPLASAYVLIYKQNSDGSWPATTPGWGTTFHAVQTGPAGTYETGDLPFGNYKVRFFTVHTGSQWWEYVATVDLATVLTIDTAEQRLDGIDGWFGKP